MEQSRPSTPEAPPQDLWSSILDSVSTSRSIPSKQILLLGEPSSGKSTLASALLHKASTNDTKEDGLDFALGYDWAHVKDDADEDTLARLSVYQVPSSAPAYTRLVHHFLPPRTSIPRTLVMIVLDWTRPWTFMEHLETWFTWIEQWAAGDGARELEIVREEGRERLQFNLQHYTEPSSDPIPTSSSSLSNTVLPLGPGTLTHNKSGVPIMIVCTKADLIDDSADLAGTNTSGMGGMVKGKGGEWEERTDGIMQILRTICLKYGAALFYTTPLPATLQVARQYALHSLFSPPAPSPGTQPTAETTAATRNPFPFQHKPNTLDRDRIVVPAGWDSWGKIGILRDGFDAKAWGEGWDRDLDAANGEIPTIPGARAMFSTLVADQSDKPATLPSFNSPVPEQSFLAKHYDENAKKPNQDPRGKFLQNEDIGAGLVGPLGNSTFSLPTVVRAMNEMDGGAGLGASVNGEGPRKPVRAGTRALPSGLGSSTSGPLRQSTTSPTLPATPGSGGPDDHKALHEFFNSLLKKDRAGAGGPVATVAKGNEPPTDDSEEKE